jgi:gamma-glutamyltranspeptidase/glutathione hydrolase
MPGQGAVAAGHPATVETAASILAAGGSAFDACVGAIATACVVEPVLASLGGGGYLLAIPAGAKPRIYDFFVQTPRQKKPPAEIDFRSVHAHFGDNVTQEFHIGAGAVATPGLVNGLFEVHDSLCRMTMAELLQTAIAQARNGITVRDFDSDVMQIVSAIFQNSPECLAQYASPTDPNRLGQPGDCLRLPELADVMEALAYEGADLFYKGEVGQRLCEHVGAGGHLTRDDLLHYESQRRTAMETPCFDGHMSFNPGAGGLLLAFAMDLARNAPFGAHGSVSTLLQIADIMALTTEVHSTHLANHGGVSLGVLNDILLERYRKEVVARATSRRGTTHISIIDADGNIASATLSNGECAGLVIPGTGITLNNMLGEEDLNPGGFHRWTHDERMTSIMSPTAVRFTDGRVLATGSGGSNRIRSALMQVLINLLHFKMPVEAAVMQPRIHLEGHYLSVEGGHDMEQIGALLDRWPQHEVFSNPSMFFGGAHTLMADGNGNVDGAGDPRRGGSWTRV